MAWNDPKREHLRESTPANQSDGLISAITAERGAERGIGVAGPLLRAWLAAAGDRDGALRAFDTAGALLPADPIDPALPFLFLGGGHLDRWRGNALAQLGEPDAIGQLTGALARLPPAWVRSRCALLVDLALAYAAAGDRDAAQAHARTARRLAQQVRSDRHLR